MTMPCHFCKWIFLLWLRLASRLVATLKMTKSPKNSPAHQKNPKFSTNPKNSPKFPPKTKFSQKFQKFPNTQNSHPKTQKSPQTPAKYNSNYNFPPKSPQKFRQKQKIPFVQKLYIIIYAKIFTLLIKNLWIFRFVLTHFAQYDNALVILSKAKYP